MPRSAHWNYGGKNWTLSRGKIDLFCECKRCFYLDNKLGIKRPSGPSFTLNNAVDELLKKEFDTHRNNATTHSLMQTYGVDAVPFDDSRMNEWRDALKRGISFFHNETGLLVRGGIDDVWVRPDGELIIADYKATSKDKDLTVEDLYDSYKRQMEVYQWLFRKNNFIVSDVGYFVYANGRTDLEAFDGKLEFEVKLIAYTGNDDWVEKTLFDIKQTLESDTIPDIGKSFNGGPCDFCTYREVAGKTLLALHKKERDSQKSGESGTLF